MFKTEMMKYIHNNMYWVIIVLFMIHNVAAQALSSLSSTSFVDTLKNFKNENARTSMVIADAKGMLAIHKVDWKYIHNTLPEGFPEQRMNQYKDVKTESYNLANNSSKTENLLEKYPEKAQELLVE